MPLSANVLFHHTSATPKRSKEWCVFSHFDPNGRVEPYVLLYLAELQRCGFSVVFVSTSEKLDEDCVDALKGVATVAIVRENAGYDFGSYKAGITYLDTQDITPQRLLLTNDSVYGPFHDLDQFFQAAKKYDLYGMTDSFDFHHHLQSYFLVYGQRVLESTDFKEFWNRVELIDSGEPGFKQKIIMRYEVGGTQFFLERGYTVGSAFPFSDILPRAVDAYVAQLREAQQKVGSSIRSMDIKFNATHRFWNTLLEMGFPFLKRELLLLNPTNADIDQWVDVVRSISNYDLTMVISAMINYSGNDNFFFTTHPSTVAQLVRDDGTVTLPINPIFQQWQTQFKVPDTRSFSFNEDLYLEKSPDVRVAIMNDKVKSGLHHFRNNGFREGRPLALTRLPE